MRLGSREGPRSHVMDWIHEFGFYPMDMGTALNRFKKLILAVCRKQLGGEQEGVQDLTKREMKAWASMVAEGVTEIGPTQVVFNNDSIRCPRGEERRMSNSQIPAKDKSVGG